MSHQHHCAFCGMGLEEGVQRRLFNMPESKEFVRDKCKETPFIYPVILATERQPGSPPKKQYLCIPCVNWKRRAENGWLKRTKQPMLQLDQMILFLLQPGRFPEPDHRCMERLVKAVRQPDNLYHRVFPMPVQWITRRIEGDTFQHCVAAWWLYNNKTEFFASPQEAKRVRGVVKNGLVDPADV
jgi:hypothetical protein